MTFFEKLHQRIDVGFIRSDMDHICTGLKKCRFEVFLIINESLCVFLSKRPGSGIEKDLSTCLRICRFDQTDIGQCFFSLILYVEPDDVMSFFSNP